MPEEAVMFSPAEAVNWYNVATAAVTFAGAFWLGRRLKKEYDVPVKRIVLSSLPVLAGTVLSIYMITPEKK